jgi:hypothetical protein
MRVGPHRATQRRRARRRVQERLDGWLRQVDVLIVLIMALTYGYLQVCVLQRVALHRTIHGGLRLWAGRPCHCIGRALHRGVVGGQVPWQRRVQVPWGLSVCSQHPLPPQNKVAGLTTALQGSWKFGKMDGHGVYTNVQGSKCVVAAAF